MLTIRREDTASLVGNRWCADFTSYKKLDKFLLKCAKAGHSTPCLYVDSLTKYDEVKRELTKNGFDVEDYSDDNIMLINIGY